MILNINFVCKIIGENRIFYLPNLTFNNKTYKVLTILLASKYMFLSRKNFVSEYVENISGRDYRERRTVSKSFAHTD